MEGEKARPTEPSESAGEGRPPVSTPAGGRESRLSLGALDSGLDSGSLDAAIRALHGGEVSLALAMLEDERRRRSSASHPVERVAGVVPPTPTPSID